MFKVPFRMIWKEKARFFITIGGIGFTVLLILFLFGIYAGVKNGATSYVQNNETDIWICQKNSTNLLRSSSFLTERIKKEVLDIKGIMETSVVLRLLTTAEINNKSKTMFIFGFRPESKLGMPPFIEKGNRKIKKGEIIIDRAFALKYDYTVGDSLTIQGRDFIIAGICKETNAIVAQFAFITLTDAQKLLGFPKVCSFYLIKTDPGSNTTGIVEELKKYYPNHAVFTRDEFTRNNLDELKTGVLPILWTIAILGAFTGIAVISLMLYSSVLEKKEDYALLKAIGSSQGYINLLVIKQSLLGAVFGFSLGVCVNEIATLFISKLVPEISIVLTSTAIVTVLIVSILICCAGSLIPIQKLAKIYPGEVFRA